jgi:hypothetical protein
MKTYEKNSFEGRDVFESRKTKSSVVSALAGNLSPFLPDQKLMRSLIKAIATFSAIIDDNIYLEDGGKALTEDFLSKFGF